MNGNVIDAVLLDAGGVLVLPHHEVLVEHALGPIGVVPDVEELDRAHYHGARELEVWPEDEVAIFSRFNRAYLERIGADPSEANVAALNAAFQRFDMWTRPAPGAREGLAAIAATGVKMAIVSNADGQVEQILAELELCQVGPGRGVEIHAVIDSHVVGVAKPDARIFHIALERIDVAAAQAVHVGDIVGADVAGATSAGANALHFDPLHLCESADHHHAATLVEVAEVVTASRSGR